MGRRSVDADNLVCRERRPLPAANAVRQQSVRRSVGEDWISAAVKPWLPVAEHVITVDDAA